MSKTWWSVATAFGLIVVALAIFVVRKAFGGDVAPAPGAATWRVTLAISGRLDSPHASVTTVRPLAFRRQHIFDERYQSKELLHRIAPTTDPRHHEVSWRGLQVTGEQSFRLNYSFRCATGLTPTEAMIRRSRELDAAPIGGAAT